MSYGLKLATPTQCVSQTVTWSGPPVQKALGMWVQDTNYFAEIVRSNLTDSLGTVEWVCDVPAGAWIAFELYSMPDGSDWTATRFYQVQPGVTDACLRTNEGQKAVASMAALASTLSSVSPQLFTYPATTTSTTPSPTTIAPPDTIAPEPKPSPSSSPINAGALAGGIAGGVSGVLVLALLVFLLFRRRARRSAIPPSNSDGGGFFRAVPTNPVDAWRARVQSGTPPSRLSRAPSSATLAGLVGRTSPPPPVTGPRAGVPEVGEASDIAAYHAPGLGLAPYGRHLAASAVPARPPTRLTTPGGLTEVSGAGDETVGAGAGYASYSRV
ncbi:hypothetical protein JCM3770_001683 [Rhodotorula araucariae]